MKVKLIILFFVIINSVYSQKNDTEVAVWKSKAKIELGEYERAVEILNKAIKFKENYKLYLQRAEAFYLQNKYDKALDDYIHSNNIKNGIANFQIAKIFAKKNDVKNTIKYLELYLKQRNKLSEPEIKQTNEFKNIENSNEWKNLWRAKHYSKYEINLSDAKYAISKNKFVEAFDLLFDLIDKSNIKDKAYALRGDLFASKKEFRKAIKDYTQAIKLKKNKYEYLIKRAETYYKNRQFKKAVKDYEKYLNNNFNPKIYLKKSISELKLNMTDNAITSINLYLKYYPENEETFFLLYKAYLQKNDYIEALENINFCIEKNKPDIKYFMARGEIYFKIGLYKLSANDFSMCLDLNPNSGETYYLKANSEYKSGNYMTACANWHKALLLKYYKASDKIEKFCK